MFKNRSVELEILESIYRSPKPRLLLLYGKRRVGKTELLQEFSKRHKVLYLVSRQESSTNQLKKMSEDMAVFFDDDIIRLNPFQNYDALFSYLHKKKVPVIFDEFPYLVESNRSLPSILQDHWDNSFSKTGSFIILCGSSIRMMESLLAYSSPIYGRRTDQMLLEPLKFKDACRFFPGLSKEQKIIFYSVLGGTPAYLLEFDYSRSLFHNLKGKVLQKTTFLYQDVLFVLQQELNEPSTYYSIIKSIANGNARLGLIVNDTGFDKAKVTKYLSVLQNLHLIERRVPITEKRPEKSRKGIYLLKDNYFKFWFRFVFENNAYIEQNKQEKLIDEKIRPELNTFVGRSYEEVSLEWIKEQKKFRNFIFGRWWSRTAEIDLVGIDKKDNKILFGEVKWANINLKQANKIIRQLKEKSEHVEWGKNPSKEFILIGKNIESKHELKAQGVSAFDLDDLLQSKKSM